MFMLFFIFISLMFIVVFMFGSVYGVEIVIFYRELSGDCWFVI